jgi:hypothetical protein
MKRSNKSFSVEVSGVVVTSRDGRGVTWRTSSQAILLRREQNAFVPESSLRLTTVYLCYERHATVRSSCDANLRPLMISTERSLFCCQRLNHSFVWSGRPPAGHLLSI